MFRSCGADSPRYALTRPELRRPGGHNNLYHLLLARFARRHAAIAAKNLALRQQLAVLHVSVKRPGLRQRDRIFWVWLLRVWPGRRSSLVIVKPENVIRRHREDFRLCWRWSSRKRSSRPKIDAEIRCLIRQMSCDNPMCGAPRIQSELHLLGYAVAESTVAKYMNRGCKPPSQTWRTFLENDVGQTAAIDLCTVHTVTFRILFCFLVLRHEHQRVVHFNVIAHATARWTAQRIVEAFPYDEASRFLTRDRDGMYGQDFRHRVKRRGMEEVIAAFRSPWQFLFVECLIGSIRRKCLDHVMVLDEAQRVPICAAHFGSYHWLRTHLSLYRKAPAPRQVEHPTSGRVIAIPRVGGLHQRCSRAG